MTPSADVTSTHLTSAHLTSAHLDAVTRAVPRDLGARDASDQDGWHIEGVVTTGIYCRSDCAANPLPQNTRRFPTTVAAEAAGFRACLRCRPWRLPAPEVRDAPIAVERALMLIAEGFLDEHGEAALARRVRVSVRHLRREFERVVGASPDQVARSRRAHFARRLLDESDLPVSAVAFSAGFGSTRQFNRVMQETFRATPQELRSRRRRSDVLATDGGLRLRVPYKPPLPAPLMVDYLRPRAIPGVESVVDGVYRRTTQSCGFPGVIEVCDSLEVPRAPREGRHVEMVAHLPSYAALIEEVARVRRLLRLDLDPTPATEALEDDAVLGPLIAETPGIRLPACWDRFETGVRVLLGQQISVSGATTLAGRLAARYGEPLELRLPDGLTHLFPTAARLAEADDLAEIGMPRARGASLQAFAQRYAEGELELDGVADLDELTGELMEIPGIGPWSAHLLAARMFGHADAFPASDLGLRRKAALLLGREQPLTSEELSSLAERWRPFRATAAAYLWMAAAPGLVTGG